LSLPARKIIVVEKLIKNPRFIDVFNKLGVFNDVTPLFSLI
jgi:hypothetical protein